MMRSEVFIAQSKNQRGMTSTIASSLAKAIHMSRLLLICLLISTPQLLQGQFTEQIGQDVPGVHERGMLGDVVKFSGDGTLAESAVVGAVAKKVPALSLSAISKIYGDADFDLAAITTALGEDVGTYALENSLFNPEYDITFVPANLTIGKADLTATADDQSKFLGEANPVFTISYSGFVNGDSETDITVPSATTTADESSALGTYDITLSGGESSNYNISLVKGTLTVEQRPFITSWEITSSQINRSRTYFRSNSDYTFNYTVDWGDGNVDNDLTGDANHTYATEGNFTVKITGDFPKLEFGQSSVTSIDQWGDIEWESMENALIGASTFTMKATDAPKLSGVTSMKRMFERTQVGSPDLTNWDVSTITDMSEMFKESDFNGNISNWNLGSVTNMSSMFTEAESFNSDISAWNTENVTDMSFMFNMAKAFDQDIDSWNVSKVTTMESMFNEAIAFNQDLNPWVVTSATTMKDMFRDAEAFNGDITGWNMSNVTNTEAMFRNARAFNKDLDRWDMSAVTRMNGMFSDAVVFNQDLNSWTVDQVESFSAMFQDAEAFNGNISSWNVSNATRLERMFEGATVFNSDITNWQPTNTENLTAMFRNAKAFDQDISGWRFPNADRLNQMFYEADAFNQDISEWETENIVDMSSMFEDALAFNQSVSTWNIGMVRSMGDMFEGAIAFNQSFDGWVFSESLTSLSDFLEDATSFNQSLASLNISGIERMGDMLSNTAMSIANYDATLIAWAAQEVQNDVELGVEGLQYCVGSAARQSLMDDYNWTFDGDAQSCTATVTIADISGNEDDGNITITLNSDAFVVGGFTVDVSTADGTATAGTDYTAVTSQTITFAGTVGETQTFTISPTVDTNVEANETLTVNMGNLVTGANNTVTITDQATVTINDDDEPVVAFTSTSTSNSESTTNSSIEVNLNQAGVSTATVDYTVTGTATSGTDYTLANGTLTFVAGDVAENISLAIIDDVLIEADETVIIILSNPSGASLGTNTVFTYNIENNDAKVTIEDVSQPEDDGKLLVTTTLEGNISGGFTVDVATTDGTATTADGDYTALSGHTLTFAGTDGETQTFEVSPGADSKLEASENLTLAMSNLAGTTATVTITDGATLTITNDDAAAVTIADVSGNEGDGAITVTATLDNAVQGGFTVEVSTVDGTATVANNDYTALSGQTLTFTGTAGETQTFTVTPTDDLIIENDENLTISLSNLSTSLGVDITDGATVTITNDDFNNFPTDISLSTTSIAENNALDATIGNLATTDADAGDSHTYSLVSGTGADDNGSFTIDGNTLKVNNTSFNFEDRTSYSIRVQTDDGNGGTFAKALTVEVTNVNETPFALSLTNSTIDEADEAQQVGSLMTLDPDNGDSFSYTLVAGEGDTDNGQFAISGSTLSTAGAIDFEDGASRNIRVQVTDAGGLTFEQAFTITIEDVVAEPVRDFTTNVPGGEVKNVFSPNGDGVNETWVIEDLLDNPFNEVKVFAQGGKLIYNKVNYSNDWGGTFRNNPVPDGTYYYEIVIFANAQSTTPARTIKGFLTIIRNR